jgi:hypothetical protein
LLSLLENALLLFVLPVLAIQLALPKFGYLVGLLRLWLCGRRRISFNLLLGSGWKRWSILVICKQVWRVLGQLWNGDQAG